MLITLLLAVGDLLLVARDVLAIVGLLTIFGAGMVGVLIWADGVMDAANPTR